MTAGQAELAHEAAELRAVVVGGRVLHRGGDAPADRFLAGDHGEGSGVDVPIVAAAPARVSGLRVLE